jgi:RNA polymerase sigma factor (TIGR02999 family)
MRRASDITGLLTAWSRGEDSALDRLISIVYTDLRKVAANRLRSERHGHSLSATALVHETYLRLSGGQLGHLENRVHFFAVASQLMRRILVDHARRRSAAKRSGGVRLVLEEGMAAGPAPDFDLMALDDALSALAALDPRQAHVVELRFFGGLSSEDAALVLGVSRATVERDWGLARAWLYRRLRGTREDPAPDRARRT